MPINPNIALNSRVANISDISGSVLQSVKDKKDKDEAKAEREQVRKDNRAERALDRDISQDRFEKSFDLQSRQFDLSEKRGASADARADRALALQESGFASQEELRDLQIASAKLDNLDKREQSRFDSVIVGAAGLNVFLDSQDLEGAEQYLLNRKKQLGEEIANGQERDTVDTDRAIEIVRSGDPEQLNQLIQQTNSLVKLGQLRGSLKIPAKTNTPASIQFADELGRARKAGDNQRVNDLLTANKNLRKGQEVDEDGNIINQEGSVEAQAEEKGAIKKAEKLAVSDAEAESLLSDMNANLPRLTEVVGELRELAKTATFTKAGKALDTSRRELGLPVSEGGVDRAKMIAVVDNEVLPLLRQTFGAAFTKAEGDSLKATLVNPDLSGPEKMATLDAFIKSKEGQIESLQRRTGQTEIIDFNDLKDE